MVPGGTVPRGTVPGGVVPSAADIAATLAQERETLRAFGVRRLLLFGSAARGEAGKGSDLDFLVDLEPKTFRNYMGLREWLGARFGLPIDLVTVGSLKPALLERVQREAVFVA